MVGMIMTSEKVAKALAVVATILFVSGSGLARAEQLALSDVEYDPAAGVPKVLHQIWASEEELPPNIAATAASCADMLDDSWSYKLWTRGDIEQLAKANYPWLARALVVTDEHTLTTSATVVTTMRAQSRPAASTVALVGRYILMDLFGGVCVDVDVACRSVSTGENEGGVEAWRRAAVDAGKPIALASEYGVMADTVTVSVPGHRLWRMLLSKVASLLGSAANVPAAGNRVSFFSGQVFADVVDRFGGTDVATIVAIVPKKATSATAAATARHTLWRGNGGGEPGVSSPPLVPIAADAALVEASVDKAEREASGARVDASFVLLEARPSPRLSGLDLVMDHAAMLSEAIATLAGGTESAAADVSFEDAVPFAGGGVVFRLSIAMPSGEVAAAVAAQLRSADAKGVIGRLCHASVRLAAPPTAVVVGADGWPESHRRQKRALSPSSSLTPLSRDDEGGAMGWRSDKVAHPMSPSKRETGRLLTTFVSVGVSTKTAAAAAVGTETDAYDDGNVTLADHSTLDPDFAIGSSGASSSLKTTTETTQGAGCLRPDWSDYPGFADDCDEATPVGGHCGLSCAKGYVGPLTHFWNHSLSPSKDSYPDPYIKCEADGRWVDQMDTVCIPEQDFNSLINAMVVPSCGPPAAIPEGIQHNCGDATAVGAICDVFCAQGYIGSTSQGGRSTLACQADGGWEVTGGEISCVEEENPAVIGTASPTQCAAPAGAGFVHDCAAPSAVGESCTVSCALGHTLIASGGDAAATTGAVNVTCVSDEGTEGGSSASLQPEVRCEAAVCHSVDLMSNVFGDAVFWCEGDKAIGSACRLACPNGTVGETTVAVCQGVGESSAGWVGSAPICAEPDGKHGPLLECLNVSALSTTGGEASELPVELGPAFAPHMFAYALLVPNRYDELHVSTACNNIAVRRDVQGVTFGSAVHDGGPLQSHDGSTAAGGWDRIFSLAPGTQRVTVNVHGSPSWNVTEYIIVVQREEGGEMRLGEGVGTKTGEAAALEDGKVEMRASLRLVGVEWQPTWLALHRASVSEALAYSLGLSDGASSRGFVNITAAYPGSVVVDFRLLALPEDADSFNARFDSAVIDNSFSSNLCTVADVCPSAITVVRALDYPRQRVVPDATPTPTPTPVPTPTPTPTPTPSPPPTPTPTPTPLPRGLGRCGTVDGRTCVQAFADAGCNQDNLEAVGQASLCVGFEDCQHLALVDGVCEQFPVVRKSAPAIEWEDCYHPEALKCVEEMIKRGCQAPVVDAPCHRYKSCQRLAAENPYTACHRVGEVFPATPAIWSFYSHYSLMMLMWIHFGAAGLLI